MKDQLNFTHINLGDIGLVKVVGTEKETLISAMSEDKTLIILGSFRSIAEFIGTFGMPVNKLKTILSFDEYDEKSKITVSNKDEIVKHQV